MAASDVTFQRQDYRTAVPSWDLVDDVVGGERSIKAKGDVYLPRPNPMDKSEQNRVRYDQYKLRSVFYNATGRTLQGLIGAAYRKPPEIMLPSGMDYLLEDVDGHSVGLVQQSQNLLSQVLKKGRAGLFVDFPPVEGPVSRADLTQVRATISAVEAKQVINWRTERVGSRDMLTMVVIHETIMEPTVDGFGVEEVEQYRALRLIEGVYTVEVYRVHEGAWSAKETYTPRAGTGGTWSFIPFTFVGAQNNDPAIDMAPMYDLSVLNVAHYRNSADYEDSAYFIGQAQPWISGLDEHWRDHIEETGLYIGSRSPMLLPVDGKFGITQAEPTTLVKEAMDQKEAQMVALGARLVTRGQAVKTATEAQGEIEAEHSVLSLVIDNLNEAYTQAVEWAGEFMRVSGEVEIAINKEFSEHTIDAQRLTALVGAWQSGALPNADLWTELRRGGLIDPEKTDEEIQEEIDVDPTSLGLDIE